MRIYNGKEFLSSVNGESDFRKVTENESLGVFYTSYCRPPLANGIPAAGKRRQTDLTASRSLFLFASKLMISLLIDRTS